MAVVAPGVKVSYEDILSLGETNQRIELFDGDLVMAAMPALYHQRIATQLTLLVGPYIVKNDVGVLYGAPIDVVISEYVVFQPDMSFVQKSRLHICEKERMTAAPDLVVEILSPSTEKRDRSIKLREYARGGATEYWIVSPESREIEVYCISPNGFQHVQTFGDQDTFNTSLFPNLHFRVQEVFP